MSTKLIITGQQILVLKFFVTLSAQRESSMSFTNLNFIIHNSNLRNYTELNC